MGDPRRIHGDSDHPVEARAGGIRLGSVVTGGYRVDAEVGCGGMATVYRATASCGAVLAIKALRTEAVTTSATEDRFLEEPRLLQMVVDPHIVRLLDVGVYNALPFFAMEFVDGTDLRACPEMCRPGGLGFGRALAVLEAVSRGVTAIHAAGLVHLDLKPGNILIANDHRIKICDFGLAQIAGQSSWLAEDEVAGTPGYIAPEIAAGEGIHPSFAADIFALGAIAYDLVTGVRPENRGTETTRPLDHELDAALPPHFMARSDLPLTFRHLVSSAMAPNAASRPSAAEFLGCVRWLHLEARQRGPTDAGR